MLANKIQHQPWLAHIDRCMCPSVGQNLHCPIYGIISQGLCDSCKRRWPTAANNVEGVAHQLWLMHIDVTQRQEASTKAYVLSSSYLSKRQVASSMQHCSWFVASAMTCAHHLADVRSGVAALPWLVHITHRSSDLAFPHRPYLVPKV